MAFRKDDAMLVAASSKNTGFTQIIDLGFYGKGIFGAGYGWDWVRQIDGKAAQDKKYPSMTSCAILPPLDSACPNLFCGASSMLATWLFPNESA